MLLVVNPPSEADHIVVIVSFLRRSLLATVTLLCVPALPDKSTELTSVDAVPGAAASDEVLVHGEAVQYPRGGSCWPTKRRLVSAC